MKPLIGLLLRALSLVALASSGAAQTSQSSPTSQAAQTARATELRAQAASDAAVVANLAEGSALQIVQRRGAWSEVRAADGKQGWVRMLHLRMGGSTATQPSTASNASTGGASLNALAGILAPSRAGSSAVVTTGVRGLDEADLKNARPNPNELRRMQTFAANKPAGEDFGRRSRLNAQRVDYLGPAVAPTATRDGAAAGSSAPQTPIDP